MNDTGKEQVRNSIFKLRTEGKKRKEICEILNIDFIVYAELLKFKTELETLHQKVENFKARNNNFPKIDFTIQDVIKKFGKNPVCYLTGKQLKYKYCALDHIIPVSSDGSNELENLGITSETMNMFKYTHQIDDLLKLSISLLEFNGYVVTKKK